MSCFGKKYVFININEQINYDEVKEGIVYICENDKLFQLKCPCGCGETIVGQLFPCDKPRWRVDLNTNSLSPSINRTIGCKSHFQITNGITHK